MIAKVSILFENYKDLLAEFNHFLPSGFRIEIPHQKPESEMDRARTFVEKIKSKFLSHSNIYSLFVENLHSFLKKGQHADLERISDLLKDHPDLLKEFTHFLPDKSSNDTSQYDNIVDDKEDSIGTMQPLVENMGKGVESGRFSFFDGSSRKRKTTSNSLGMMGNDGIGKRNRDEDIEMQDEKDTLFQNMRFFSQLKKKLDNDDIYEDILKILYLYSEDLISLSEMTVLLGDLFNEKSDLFHRFCNFFGMREVVKSNPVNPSDLDTELLSDRCGPSYRAVLPNYKPLPSSGMRLLCEQVLNDTWVSCPTGSEDAGFKATLKNHYEEELFACEDQRCELDLTIELNMSGILALESILNRFKRSKEEEKRNFKIAEGELKILHMRSVEKLYAGKGPDIIEGLFLNPVIAVPIILKRLRQKDLEWRKSRLDFQKSWREIYEKNFFKSLDHQAAYFKQAEKKTLSSKVTFFYMIFFKYSFIVLFFLYHVNRSSFRKLSKSIMNN